MENVTPAQLFSGKKRNVKNLKVFGCIANRLLNEKSLDKIGGLEMKFVFLLDTMTLDFDYEVGINYKKIHCHEM